MPPRESLLEQLPLQLQYRIENGSQSARAKILAHEERLDAELRRYTNALSRDLHQFAETTLNNDREKRIIKPQQPKLKSIVKGRASSSGGEKRVSFSESPPQVETFFGGSDSDSELVIQSVDSDVSDSETVTSLNSEREGLSDHIDHTANGRPIIPPPPPPPPPIYRQYQSEAIQNNGDHAHMNEPQFSFEDVIEQGDEDGPTSQPIPRNDNDVDHKRPSHYEHPSSDDAFVVGSAPINIRLPGTGLDGDGGPMPKSLLEREDEIGTYPYDPDALNIGEINPATMSFSQRMMWEQQRKT